MTSVESVRAVRGRGLRGDRYFESGEAASASAVTLIEAEALTALEGELGVRLTFGESRRNILTSGIALNALVGRDFNVGGVVLRGTGLCQPCWHIANSDPRVVRGLVNRGGLRAQVVKSGVISVNDAIAAKQVSHAVDAAATVC